MSRWWNISVSSGVKLSLLRVHQAMQVETRQDQKANGYKLPQDHDIMKFLNSFVHTAPPTHRVLPPEMNNEEQYYLPDNVGIYDEENLQPSLPTKNWSGANWPGQDWAKPSDVAIATKPTDDFNPTIESDDYKEMMKRLNTWSASNAQQIKDQAKTHRQMYNLTKATLDRLGQKVRRKTRPPPKMSVNNLSILTRREPTSVEEMQELVEDYDADVHGIPRPPIALLEDDNGDPEVTAEISALRRDGTRLVCWGCTMSDHMAPDCPMLRQLKGNDILYYDDPTKTRFWTPLTTANTSWEHVQA
jgi:hypothetical protein